jgi:hypothetical protein
MALPAASRSIAARMSSTGTCIFSARLCVAGGACGLHEVAIKLHSNGGIEGFHWVSASMEWTKRAVDDALRRLLSQDFQFQS